MIRPDRIVVTSNYLPEELWDDEGITLPLRRRFKFVKFSSMAVRELQ